MNSPLSSLNSLKYRSDIDGLRALAVSLVIGFHAFPEYIKGGFVGVDIFFVISGFLISTIILKSLDENNFSFIEFYARRIKRIFPALITVLIFCGIAGYFLLLPTEIKQLSKHIMGGVGFVSNFILWKESGYFDSSAYTKPLLHLWSLSIEWQFYMLWPVTLYVCLKRNINLLSVTIVLFILSFVLNIKGIKHHNIPIFYLPMGRFWELLSGSLLAWALLYGKIPSQALNAIDQRLGGILYNVPPAANGRTLKNTQSALGCLLIVAGLLCIKKTHFPGWSATIPVLGTVLIIAAGRESWINNKILSNRFIVWLGLISYPLFLWHWPLLSFAWMINDDSAPSIVLRLTLILISVILSWVTYQFIEKPMRFKEVGTSNKKTFILVFISFILGCLGYYTYKKDGCVFKEPPIVQELSKYAYDRKSAYREGKCFLRPEQGHEDFKKCDDSIQKDKKTIVLWGDSFAAHLYPGYKKFFGQNFNVVQRSLSCCPPILNLDSQIYTEIFCNQKNDHIFQFIKDNKPDRVVLAANWFGISHLLDSSKLEYTINSLKKIGVKDILLLGPICQWKDVLPNLLIKYYKKSIIKKIPERLSNLSIHCPDDCEAVDQKLSEIAKKTNINYISLKRILCNKDGCLVKLGEAIETLVQFDGGHLTTVGSEYVVSHIFQQNLP